MQEIDTPNSVIISVRLIKTIIIRIRSNNGSLTIFLGQGPRKFSIFLSFLRGWGLGSNWWEIIFVHVTCGWKKEDIGNFGSLLVIVGYLLDEYCESTTLTYCIKEGESDAPPRYFKYILIVVSTLWAQAEIYKKKD